MASGFTDGIVVAAAKRSAGVSPAGPARVLAAAVLGKMLESCRVGGEDAAEPAGGTPALRLAAGSE